MPIRPCSATSFAASQGKFAEWARSSAPPANLSWGEAAHRVGKGLLLFVQFEIHGLLQRWSVVRMVAGSREIGNFESRAQA